MADSRYKTITLVKFSLSNTFGQWKSKNLLSTEQYIGLRREVMPSTSLELADLPKNYLLNRLDVFKLNPLVELAFPREN